MISKYRKKLVSFNETCSQFFEGVGGEWGVGGVGWLSVYWREREMEVYSNFPTND